jgi:hypothetical protein
MQSTEAAAVLRKFVETNSSSPRLNVDELKQVLLNQLGLELVPTNMPVEMVVVN